MLMFVDDRHDIAVNTDLVNAAATIIRSLRCVFYNGMFLASFKKLKDRKELKTKVYDFTMMMERESLFRTDLLPAVQKRASAADRLQAS